MTSSQPRPSDVPRVCWELKVTIACRQHVVVFMCRQLSITVVGSVGTKNLHAVVASCAGEVPKGASKVPRTQRFRIIGLWAALGEPVMALPTMEAAAIHCQDLYGVDTTARRCVLPAPCLMIPRRRVTGPSQRQSFQPPGQWEDVSTLRISSSSTSSTSVVRFLSCLLLS